MLRLTFAFLAIALIATLLGFGSFTNYPWEWARIVSAVAVVLAALTYLGGTFSRQAFRRRAFWECYGEQQMRTTPAARTKRHGKTAPAPPSTIRSW